MKISKEEFDRLYISDITKKEYDSIISKINVRFSEICLKILENKSKCRWFDYDNCSYNSEESNGYFDPEEYSEFISVGGEYADLCEPYCSNPYNDPRLGFKNNQFPTRWLWEDFEEEFKEKVNEYKILSKKKSEEKALKRLQLKEKKDKIKLSIKSKLTKEELKFIKFK